MLAEVAELRFFKDEQLDFETRIALGHAYYRGSEVGEVLATISRIKDGDRRGLVPGEDGHRRAPCGQRRRERGRRPPDQRAGRPPARVRVPVHRHRVARRHRRPRPAARSLARPQAGVGAILRAVRPAHREGRDPIRGHAARRLRLPAPRAGATAGDHPEQRQRRTGQRNVDRGRRRGGRARLPRDRVRRAGTGRGVARAEAAVPAGLGGRDHARGRPARGARRRRPRAGSPCRGSARPATGRHARQPSRSGSRRW